MENEIRMEKRGISLRTLYLWLIVFAIFVSVLMIFLTFHLSTTFHELQDATDEHIKLEKAAHELMDASDYLTEKVQRFTVEGKKQYLEEYFTEAFETNRREEAIEKMSENPASEGALKQLQKALNQSKELMNLEYYAMKLVIEAKGYNDYPKILESIKLNAEDAALSEEAKLRKATELVLSDEYYRQKEIIRSNMKESLDELENLTNATESGSEEKLNNEVLLTRIVIVAEILGIYAVIWLTSTLGINPVLKAVDKIKDNSPIPEVGANEFRYLARTYNKMYAVYKKSIERLNFKASHDELTKAYNRAGYDLLLSSIDLKNTYMLMFDVDDFKKINDGFGHETGDRALIKIADVLRKNFRSDDYVCRIGGDEFVVFMVHSDPQAHELISRKINQINADLGNTQGENMPPISVSVGVAHGTAVKDTKTLVEKADEAMYRAKRNGKHGFEFYTPQFQ